MSTPWQPPVYTEVQIRPGYVDSVCSRCGAFIENFISHNRHHKALDDLKDSLLALTQILVPDLPPGMMLTPQPAIKINVVPPDRDSVTIEGGEGGKGAVGVGRYINVGRGGSGNQPGYPECPVCGAVGGGGHGGGCPNSGLATEQWVGW